MTKATPGLTDNAEQDQTILLAGESGSGKNTLLACLTLHGWDYLADDLVGLSADGQWVSGLAANISLKRGSIPVVREMSRESADHTLSRVDMRGEGYVTAPRRSVWSQPSVILFPRCRKDIEGVELQAMEPRECLAALLSSGTRPCGNRHSLRGLADCCERLPAFRCEYRSATSAVRALGDLLRC